MDECVAESQQQSGSGEEKRKEALDKDVADASREGAMPVENPFDNVEEQLLDVPLVLEWLVEAGFVSKRQAEDILIAPRTKKELSMHPLEIVASRECGWPIRQANLMNASIRFR